MFPLRPDHGHTTQHPHQVLVAWDKILTVALGVLMLGAGAMFLPHVTTQIGPFSTLFIAVVVVACVVMHIRERTTPSEPQA